MDRRAFLAAGAAAGAVGCATNGAAPGRPRELALEEVSLTEISDGLSRGRWNSSQLVEFYTKRASEIDSGGPMLRSILELNPDAGKEAWRLDEERKQGRVRGRLHGVPILIKDNIDTAGSMMTTAGSLALVGWRAPADATMVRQLRQAGALILGKTNLSEWANFRSPRSTSGWSGRGGQTRNPHVLDRNPSGSSSGSAVAVAASLCAAAIGTETDGSIVSPASANGIVGIKPTVGLVSRVGIIPISRSQDTAGPMARCVLDAAILLDAITGVDARDTATSAQQGQGVGHYAEVLDATALRGAKLGLVRTFVHNHPAVDRVLTECVRVLKDKGATVLEVKLENSAKLGEAEFEVMLYEFKAGLEAYLAQLPAGKPHTLAELIEFNRRNAAVEMPWFAQETLEQAARKGTLSESAYIEARRTCLRISRTEGIDAVMAQHALNAIVGITESPAFPTDWVNGDHFSGGSSTWAAVAGYPHITVPAGMVQSLPVGLSLFGKAWSERALISLAGAFEHATEARRKPRFLARAV